jgi:outer membrane protein assembly factor BamB
MRGMARTPPLYLGIKGHVVALDRRTGDEVWRTHLKGGDFVSVTVQDAVYAATKGEIFCLEPDTGEIRWRNPLKGMGLGLVSMGGDTTPAAELTARHAAAAAAAAGS